MSFVSLEFTGFVCALMLLYFITPMRVRCYVLLLGSLFFYYQSGWQGMVFLGAAGLITYLSALAIGALRQDKLPRKDGALPGKEVAFTILMISLVLLFAMLLYAKIGHHLQEAFDQVIQGKGITVSVIIPLGISYYTLAAVGYLADVYWKKDQPEKDPLRLMLYLCYFPQILQGPIPKHKILAPKLVEGHRFDYERVCFGLQRALWGFFKKLVIADRLLMMVSQVFDNYRDYAGVYFVFGLVGAVFQLYADFSGCMDIALGVSQIFGITLEENFRRPFFAASAAEFWRRWHISLGKWFREYVYMPLCASSWVLETGKFFRKHGGKTVSRNVVTTIPLLVVWILTGLWHGTGADYVVWGLYWGSIMVLSTWLAPFYKKINRRLGLTEDLFWWRVVRQARTFVIYMIGRLLTLPGDLAASAWIGRKIFTWNPWVLLDGTFFRLGWSAQDAWVVIFSLLILWRVSVLQERGVQIRAAVAKWPLPVRWAFYLGAVLAVAVLGIYGSGSGAASFVYMNY